MILKRVERDIYGWMYIRMKKAYKVWVIQWHWIQSNEQYGLVFGGFIFYARMTAKKKTRYDEKYQIVVETFQISDWIETRKGSNVNRPVL